MTEDEKLAREVADVFEKLCAADKRGDRMVPIQWAVTLLDAYLAAALNLSRRPDGPPIPEENPTGLRTR